MKLNKYMLLAVAATAIVGCKDKDKDNGGGSKPFVETPTEVLAALSNNQWKGVRTEFDYPHNVYDWWENANVLGDAYYCGAGVGETGNNETVCAEDVNNPPQKGALMRYVATKEDPIKVYFNHPNGDDGSPVPQEILDGIAIIESAIGRKGIFTVDLETGEMPISEISLDDNNAPQEAVDRYKDFYDEHGHKVEGGIIFSMGTANLPEDWQDTCGNVSSTFYEAGLAGRVVNDKNEYVTDKGFKWVNLGREGYSCGVTAELVAHELGHALGLGNFGYNTFADSRSANDENHFNGFGWDGVWDWRAKHILHAIYNIPAGTPLEEIKEKYGYLL